MAIMTVPPPWPAATGTPSTTANRISNRQDPEGDFDCDSAGNSFLSCFPQTGTTVIQNNTVHFVWNAGYPSFAQFDLVDVYLIHQDSLALAASQHNLNNQLGRTSFNINDSWWGTRGNSFSGKNLSYPMYFLITPSDTQDTATWPPQSTFTAIQTRVPDSILASQIAASESAASAASAASTSSPASPTATDGSNGSSGATPSRTGGGPGVTVSGSALPGSSGGLQSGSGGGGFPGWAIAVIVILGTLALLGTLLALWLGFARLKRRRNGSNASGKGKRPGHRESIGSSTPMMASVAALGGTTIAGHGEGDLASPVDEATSAGHSDLPPPPVFGAGTGGTISSGRPSSSRAPSTHTRTDEGGPFSGADAAIMAAAFRDTLRKPDFADRPLEEGESPEAPETEKDPLALELKEEGRDLRSVSSSKVRMHRMSGADRGSGSGEGMDPDADVSRSTIHPREFDTPSVDSG